MTKIGVLGGTFDPIHTGHLAIAHAAVKQFELDKVLFMPAFIPPHKAAKRDLTAAPYRVRMVQLAIQNEPKFELSELELNRAEVSYTVDTLRELQALYSNAKLFMIIGSDSLSQLKTWKEPAEIEKLCQILVAPREGFSSSIPSDGQYEWIDMAAVDVSSSRIREQYRTNQTVSEEDVPSVVTSYICETKLYQERGEAV